MKTPTDDIFQLIQSMSAAEKRYFKIHFSSGKSLVTELFNFLNSMKSYDEEEVKKHFKATKLSKNLKVYKIMLIDLLLKSLSSFRYKKSVNSTIRQSLEEVEILTEKSLYDQAYKKLAKTKKLCLKHEVYEQLIYIIDLEYQFKAFYEVEVSDESLNLLDEILHSTKKVTEVFELKKVTHELSLIAGNVAGSKISPEQATEYEHYLMNKMQELESESKKPLLKKHYYLYAALGHLYHSTNEQEKEYRNKKIIVQFFKKQKNFIETEPNKYWSSYFNFANCCLRTGRKEEFVEAMETLFAFTKRNPFFLRKMILLRVLEIAFHQKQKNFNHIIQKLEPLVLEEVEKYSEEQDKSVVYAFLSLLITHLSVGNHSKVQFYLRRLFRNNKMGEEFTYFFETVNMISHYESGDFDLLQNLLTSKKRKLKREPDFGTPFFKEVLKFFAQLLKPKNELKEKITQLRKKAKKSSGDNYLYLMEYFILEDWLGGLEEQKTYSEFVGGS